MPNTDPSERELAFTLMTGRDTVEAHPLLSACDPSQQHIITTYFDTPSQHLARSEWSISVRSILKQEDSSAIRNQENTQWVQRVKGPTKGEERPEWETPITGPQLDHAKLMMTPMRPIVVSRGSEFIPLFETDIHRSVRNLTTKFATIEVAIDEGVIHNGDHSRSVRVCDLELEQKAGDPSELYRVAIELVLDTALMMEGLSKATRGYQLLNRNDPHIVKHSDVELSKDISTGDAFQQILIDVITHLRKNIKAASDGHPGGIHQVRVAIRRLRALLLLFRRILQPESFRVFDQQLRYFGRTIGRARDWDVFVTETLVEAAEKLPTTGWLQLVEHSARDRQLQAHLDVVPELRSSRFNSLILSLMGWIKNPSLMSHAIANQPFQQVAPHLLARLAAKVDSRRRHVRDESSLHALRKAIKKLRYAVEFVEGIYPKKQTKRFLDPCKNLQEILGTINDVNVTRQLTTRLIEDRPAITPAVEMLSDWLAQRQRRAERELPKMLRQLRADQPFWE